MAGKDDGLPVTMSHVASDARARDSIAHDSFRERIGPTTQPQEHTDVTSPSILETAAVGNGATTAQADLGCPFIQGGEADESMRLLSPNEPVCLKGRITDECCQTAEAQIIKSDLQDSWDDRFAEELKQGLSACRILQVSLILGP